MIKIKYLFPVLLLISFSFVSCNNEDDDDDDFSGQSCNVEELTELLEEIIDLGALYSQNQSTANCIAYREVLEDFIEEAENCPSAQDDIDDFERVLSALNCN
ncbi:hypothetical protein [Tenacibaculum jejuense]|uniref:Probable lipoprotein n=1 Tax=Tenacibaculum jejuense TaxID=584609 RepID=A0A238UD52_9FLAO|nr:hypothetical protein [Tenacibaculum jejuense]SNR16946.1 Probable lipoprotein precursor [Tenacibaculum jejuense]